MTLQFESSRAQAPERSRALSSARALLVGSALVAAFTVTASAQTTYCATFGGQLYELDLASGSTTPLVDVNSNLTFGIANTQVADELLVSAVTAGFFNVNLTTGVVTPLASPGPPMFAICNNEDDGKTYAISLANLYEIDPSTGASTLIGATGRININGLDYHRGLQQFIGVDPITNDLIAIDPATGAGTAIGQTMPGLVGVWYDETGDDLYGICDLNNQGCIVEIDAATGTVTPLHTTGMNLVGIGGDIGGGPTPPGTNYCTAASNSTGTAASISASGSPSVSANNITLTASDMPLNQFGIFVTSRDQDFVLGAGGTSNGNLCVGGNVGRFVGPGQILSSGATGSFDLAIDLAAIPEGGSFVAVMAGETWNFQAWYRDTVGLGSNFTDGVEIGFQ